LAQARQAEAVRRAAAHPAAVRRAAAHPAAVVQVPLRGEDADSFFRVSISVKPTYYPFRFSEEVHVGFTFHKK